MATFDMLSKDEILFDTPIGVLYSHQKPTLERLLAYIMQTFSLWYTDMYVML